MDTLKLYSAALRRKKVLLTSPERSALLSRVHQDPEARKRVVESVLPLVLKIAGEFAATHRSIDMEDLIQEGGVAAMIAVDTFKEGAGSNFATWTAICVRTRYIRLSQYVGREKRTATLLPMHEPFDGDEGRAPQDILESEDPSPFDLVADQELQSQVAERLKSIKLAPSDRHILQGRILRDEQDQISLERMGVTHKVSREAIRQRQTKLIERLRPSFEEFRRAA